MSITDTSPAVRSLDNIIADIRDVHDHTVRTITAGRTEADEQIHALKVTTARLAEEAEGERLRANGLEAAGIALTADAIRREEALQAELEQARRDRNVAVAHARISSEITAAMSRDLHDKHLELRRVAEQFADATAEIGRLQAELDDANTRLAQAVPRGRFRR